MPKIIFSNADKISTLDLDGKVKEFDSAFIEKYFNNLKRSKTASAWKTEGVGARFQQTEDNFENPETLNPSINGVAITDDDSAFYSASIGNVSGIFRKNVSVVKADEGHVIHRADTEFLDFCLSPDNTKIAVSVKTDALSCHLGIFNLKDDDYYLITDGDSKEEYPSFSRLNPSVLLFSAAGIGRDYNGNFIEYSKSSLCSFNLNTQCIDTVLEDSTSLVQPKEDSLGRIWFISRPSRQKLKRPNIFLEIITIPFKIIYAVYKFLEAFTRIFTGKPFTSRTEGDNPSKSKSERDIIIDGYRIEGQKNLEKCIKRKEKFPGFAPSDWILKRLEKDGSITEIKKGVIAFDLTADDQPVFTNGKYLAQLNNDGEPIILAEARLCTKISVLK